MRRAWVYWGVIGFAVFFIWSDPTNAGAAVRDFFGFIGEFGDRLLATLDALTDDTSTSQQ